jgi:zinc transporter ZupT
VILVKWRKTAAYKYIITTMLGLSVGSLIGDALLHLLPQVLGLDDHSADSGSHEGTQVPVHVWKLLCACGSIWFYFIMQMALQGIGDAKVRRIQAAELAEQAACVDNLTFDIKVETKLDSTGYDVTQTTEIPKSDTTSNGSVAVVGLKQSDDDVSLVVHAHSSVAWMVTIGDGLHNFTDGLAIGAAFSTSWQVGLSTSIAVLTHELPHEFGDAALLLSTGWSARRVIFFQILAQLSAFVGLYMGISISESTDGAQQWIFALGAGMFLYVALSNAIPELLELYETYSSIWIAVGANVGIMVGYAAMLLLAIFEEEIQIQ